MSLPTRQADGRIPTTTQLMERAHLLEQLGYDGIWLGDAIGRVAWPLPDVLTWLTIAAAATERIELGTAVLQVPLRNTVELAQRLLTLHAVSQGRFVAGLGSGSTRADFEAVGADYETRFKVLAQALPTIRQLCAGERVGAAHLPPWAELPSGPPIVIGSWHSGPWVRRAAVEYDGWMASGFFGSFRGLRDGLERYRAAGGQRALVATITVDLRAPGAPFDEDGRFHLECPAAEAGERLQRLAELGYDDVLLTRANFGLEDLSAEDLAEIRALLPR